MPKRRTDPLRVPSDKLRWTCPVKRPGVSSTDDIKPVHGIIGQDRALQAIRTGLSIQSHGYNIYVSGLTGTGKTTTVRQLLEQIHTEGERPDDLCYVHNFSNADCPKVLSLPAGQGIPFSRDIESLVVQFQNRLPEIFERSSFKTKKKTILEGVKSQIQEAVANLEAQIRKDGLAMVQIQEGLISRPEIVPVIDNAMVQWPGLSDLKDKGRITDAEIEILRKKHDNYLEELEKIAEIHQELEKQALEAVRRLQQETIRPAIEKPIRALQKKYPREKIERHLDSVRDHILQNFDRFLPEESNDKKSAARLSRAPGPDPFLPYRVNVIVDHTTTRGTPIVIEKTPNHANLFGMIERSWDPSGIWRTDFTRIKAGSFLKANGGFLVFNFIDALAEPGVWKSLKRTLKNRQVTIQDTDLPFAPVASALKPEPVDIRVKVLVIGDEDSYRLMYELDDEFKKIFKIRADFDVEMPNTPRSVGQYLGFIAKVCQGEKLLPVNGLGIARIVEFGTRLAGKKSKLSTRFSDIADLIREAHYWASSAKSPVITEVHVQRALREKDRRLNRIEEKIDEMIKEGILRIDIEGGRVGQVNGLSVIDLGDFTFGKPSKITAETAMGKAGLISIEREAGFGGRVYNKATLILGGYLRRMYAQDKPLTVSASVCFEQSYSGVEGDSASSAEIYAILSSLSGVPLRQNVAITGSVNQKGEIQPVGGVNQKIEGFFDICKTKRLTGDQGVLIPKTNIGDLLLPEEIVQAVKKSRFHIWAVETVDQGLEKLSGLKAGVRNAKGRYPAGSIHGLVDEKLAWFADRMKNFPSSG